MTTSRLLGAAFAAAALFSLPASQPANASFLLGSTVTSATIGGTTFAFGAGAGPWSAQVYSGPNSCLRLAVTIQNTDLRMTVTAPNGATWRDDDGGGANRPLIKINGTPVNGYYTVTVNHWLGAAVDSAFTINMQRLGLNNGACLPGTPALLSPPGEQRAKR
jgi:hypothetical protein